MPQSEKELAAALAAAANPKQPLAETGFKTAEDFQAHIDKAVADRPADLRFAKTIPRTVSTYKADKTLSVSLLRDVYETTPTLIVPVGHEIDTMWRFEKATTEVLAGPDPAEAVPAADMPALGRSLRRGPRYPAPVK